MKEVALGDLIEPAKVRRAGSGNYPILSMTMHEGLVDQGVKFKKRVASEDTSDYKVVPRGHLVVGFPIDEGVLDFQTLHDLGIVSPAYGVWELSDASRVHINYLKRFLRSSRALAYYKGKLRGSTARRRSLPAELFRALPVPLPAFEEQRRIAEILEQADAIRAKRRRVLARLDTLTRSIFHDMFGFCDSDLDGLEVVALSDVLSVKTGSFLPARAQRDGPYLVYGGNGVTGKHSDFMFEDPKVVIGRVGAYCGVVHLTVKRSWITDNSLYVASMDREFSLTYLRDALTAANLNQYASQSGQPLISASRIKDVLLRVPIIDVQMRYEDRVGRIEAQRDLVQRALDADNELFASLQWRAFRGEL